MNGAPGGCARVGRFLVVLAGAPPVRRCGHPAATGAQRPGARGRSPGRSGAADRRGAAGPAAVRGNRGGARRGAGRVRAPPRCGELHDFSGKSMLNWTNVCRGGPPTRCWATSRWSAVTWENAPRWGKSPKRVLAGCAGVGTGSRRSPRRRGIDRLPRSGTCYGFGVGGEILSAIASGDSWALGTSF
jgi:hypothetical protein